MQCFLKFHLTHGLLFLHNDKLIKGTGIVHLPVRVLSPLRVIKHLVFPELRNLCCWLTMAAIGLYGKIPNSLVSVGHSSC